ncbi:pentapeptide repeat-containing protein [Vasconcelosia minhoensis]|uniref:pentapeptide repeat-containing protein n=1 Tax=Vasconcelosia minhoensis TaxID=3366354 RepID=UPI001D13B958
MVWELTPEELLIRYDYGERDFRGIKLIESERDINGEQVTLRGADLREINLRGSYLREVDLTEANLTGADLSGICLESAVLKRAIIKDACLHSANLHWCIFDEADLTGTVLNHMNACSAFFRNVKIGPFEYAVLADANFNGAMTPNQLLCRGGNLIWDTVMPDGSIVAGPQFGDGKGR